MKKDNFAIFFMILLLLFALLSFLVVRPFLSAILASAITAYAFYPLYRWLGKRIRNNRICSLMVSLFIILLITIPTAVILDNSAQEIRYGYLRVRQAIFSGNMVELECRDRNDFLCRTLGYLKGLFSDPDTKFYLETAANKISTFMLEKSYDFLLSIPHVMLNIVITFFTLFYLFVEGEKLVLRIKNLIPIKERHREHIFKKIGDMTFAVIYGSLVVAIIQGVLGAIGFYAVGISSPILWGIVMAVLALVPMVGTGVVWLPVALFLIVKGFFEANTLSVIKGFGLLIYGAIIIGGIDNILKPKIIGAKGGLHPVLVLLGALGGFGLFGFVGFIVGPLILAILKTLLDIYEKERAVH